MAEYLIQDTTLTGISDEIRILYGTEETMTPAVMTSQLGNANVEVDAQTDWIKKIMEILFRPTITIAGTIDEYYAYIEIDGVKYTSPTTISVPAGKPITLYTYCSNENIRRYFLINDTQYGINLYGTYIIESDCTISFDFKDNVGLGIINITTDTEKQYIRFIISNKKTYHHTYLTEEGMTWKEWIESMGQYALYYISDGYIYNNDGHPVKNNSGELITENVVIEEDYRYEAMPTLITFTFINTECQAEEGMTWTEWCNSDYNTLNLVINGTAVQNNKHTQAVRKVSDNQTVTANDIIIANETYNFISLA